MWNFFGSLSALTVMFLYFNLFCALAKVNASTLKVVNFFCYCVDGSCYKPGSH